MRPAYSLITMAFLCLQTDAARILGVFTLWGKSHHNFMNAVMKALAQAGHEVVVYTPFPIKDPPANYTNVFLENVRPEGEEVTKFVLEVVDLPNYKKCLDCMWKVFDKNYREFFGDVKAKELITSGEQFDLLISETWCIQEMVLIFGHIFNVPVISLQAFFTNNVVDSHFGNDLSMSYIPDCGNAFSDKMSLLERVVNTFSTLRGLYYYNNYYLANLQRRLNKDLPHLSLPPVQDLIRNVSLTFVNDHLTVDYARPRTPNIIPVGGIHIGPPNPLPKNIQKFMDEAKDGVILFSLGTYIPDDLQPKDYFQIRINVFKQLKQRVIWKTRKQDIPGLPDNVMVVPWAPQPDILAHPNCVLFITHGGIFSQHETIYYGVPVVAIPQFFDQPRNSKFYEAKEVGVMLENEAITESSLLSSIRTVLDNPKYKENMKKLSAIFKDRPMSPAETVVYWTEYVLRHRGAAHLRPASTELRWYQIALLDVFGFLILAITIIVVTFYIVFKKILFLLGIRDKYFISKEKKIS